MVAGEDAGKIGLADRLGIEYGQVVGELGWDEDVDDGVRAAVEERSGELLDKDANELLDVMLLWWRENDGDLVDPLINAIAAMAEEGVIWVLTPKTGRPGHVKPNDISEAVSTAGLAQTASISVGSDWTGTRLVSKSAKSRH